MATIDIGLSRIFHRLFVAFCALTLVSCAQTNDKFSNQNISLQTTIPINKLLFSSDEISVTNIDEVFALTSEQREEFIAFHTEKTNKGIKSHRALYLFMQNRLSNFTYYGETLIAEQAMRLNEGNCMSLAILTTALAKVVGLEVSYREVNSQPVFEKHNNLILSSSHVQSIIHDSDFTPEKGVYYISTPGLIIDYFPSSSNRIGKKVSPNEFYGKYYTNIAADALVDGNVNKAFSYAEQVYFLTPQSTEIINLLAVLHRRSGDNLTAEKYYQLALTQFDNDITLLGNYAVLLSKTNRQTEAEAVIARLEKLDDPNPYRWLEQAYFAHNANKKIQATLYYQKVIDRAPYVHQAYLGLYKIYLEDQKNHQAQAILKAGLKWAHDVEQRGVYKFKLFGENKS